MNPLNINHIKAEKAKTIKQRYQNLRKITNFFRVFEIFVILTVISRVSFHLPLSFKLSNEYFHNLSLFLVSPRFVFTVGNAIVIVLFVNSGQFNTQSDAKIPETPSCDQKNAKYHTKEQRKTEENTIMASLFASPEHQVIKVYHQSKSEKLKRVKREKSCLELRRSKTEMKSLKDCWGCTETGECHYPEDHMSNEEFRKTVEDFIAKQQRFLREEEEVPDLKGCF